MDRSMDEWIEGWESWGMNGWNRRTDGRSCTSITGTYVLFNDLYTHSFFWIRYLTMCITLFSNKNNERIGIGMILVHGVAKSTYYLFNYYLSPDHHHLGQYFKKGPPQPSQASSSLVASNFFANSFVILSLSSFLSQSLRKIVFLVFHRSFNTSTSFDFAFSTNLTEIAC